MFPTAAVPTYDQVYADLGNIYDPQTKLVQSQIDQLQPQQDAQQASLDQAKVNAFKDITNSANAKGMLFSGVPIDQQATYTGTKYLPAVANLKSTFQNSRNTLLGQINRIMAERSLSARDYVTKGQQAANDAAYKQAQLDLGYARLSSSNANSAADRAARRSGGGLTANEQRGLIPSQAIQYWQNTPTLDTTGKYNPSSTNYHRWQAAEQDLMAQGFDPYSGTLRTALINAFGAPWEKAATGGANPGG